MKLTDDEIVIVLRCAADLCWDGRVYGVVHHAAVSLGLPRSAVYRVAGAARRAGVEVYLDRSRAKRDALLEAAARIEEGR